MSDRRFTRPRYELWTAYLAAGVLAVALHAVLPAGSTAQDLLYDVIGASAVVVGLIAIRRYRPDPALPWVLLCAGQALFVAGDLMWNYYEFVGEEPFPSLADGLYLAGYPFLAAGLLLLIRRRIAGGDRAGLIDAGILATAVGILSWTFLIQPQLAGSELDPLSLAITLAYPLADLLVIGVAMGFLTTPGARTAAFRLLGTSLVLLLVADEVYALQNLDGTYVVGGPIDSLYLISYLLFGASLAHPSMRELTEPHPVAVTWLGPMRLVATGTASASAVKRAALGCLGLAAILGLALAIATSWWLLAVGAAAILAAWGYTGGPKPYGYLGLGELFVFTFFGLVATVGTTYVAIEGPSPDLRPGMTARGEISVTRPGVVVRVPIRALRWVGERYVVAVRTPGGFERREVTAGASDGTLIEVRSGLEPGEVVAIDPAAVLPPDPEAEGPVASGP